MIEKEYYLPLPDGNAIKVRRRQEKAQILDFTVQLKTFVSQEEGWREIVRVDTAHGFVHLDEFDPKRRLRKTVLDFASYNEALSWAIKHLKERWLFYAERYKKAAERGGRSE